MAEELLAISAELGKEPSYILSDNGSNHCKASRDLKLKHHRDISHSFGLFLERVYKEDAEFKSFIESMEKTRRYALTSVAYLMPPKQRSIARFMNMFNGVEWARCKALSTRLMLSGSVRMRRLQEYIMDYFSKETRLLKLATEIHTISSDVIESTFGFYKS